MLLLLMALHAIELLRVHHKTACHTYRFCHYHNNKSVVTKSQNDASKLLKSDVIYFTLLLRTYDNLSYYAVMQPSASLETMPLAEYEPTIPTENPGMGEQLGGVIGQEGTDTIDQGHPPLSPAEEAEFEEAYRDNFKLVFRIANRFVQDPCAAEDVAQEAFLNAYRRWGSFTNRGNGRTPWLATIAHNAAINHLRRKTTSNETPWDTLEDPTAASFGAAGTHASLSYEPSAEDAALARDHTSLAEALRQLPREQANALVARYIVGESAKEHANTAGIPAGTVRSRVHRGANLLLELLGVEPKSEEGYRPTTKKNALAALMGFAIGEDNT